ncbi:hypothetical protein ACQEU5_07780 [Marinactinospora thermotolerans]|uniref:Uncharacterized protein n=1 Tax=Marinactinospora thermotolerans DSM 45154 TaxID=1122192 RepID=A0A1T4R7A4_9ACTN|nr:hypothetical protein [Marinactinospora thermotolerans]SKA11558.1 hypothetical protein SAMN02745673_02561 [Marinactinospora thermotolerans DSM 45154]
MPLPEPAGPDPVRLPHIHGAEPQRDLVDRITSGLGAHECVVMGALTARDRQRIIAAGKVAGKRLKRSTVITETDAGIEIAFDDDTELLIRPAPDPLVFESGSEEAADISSSRLDPRRRHAVDEDTPPKKRVPRD